jgi:23S rRNA pseudouridine1911/1915/1917 synthase
VSAELQALAGRLDAVLAELTGESRADVVRAISEGRVLVDGVARPKSHRLEGGERISADLSGPAALKPDPNPVEILYQDDHLLVISKPPGLVVHPTAAQRDGTLVSRLMGMGIPLSSGSEPDRPGIVHRLDAGTSGALVVAKDDATHAALREMFSRHDVDRRYLALVRGNVVDETFAVDAALNRREGRTVLDAAAGVQARTEFSVKERHGRSTLVEARPQTGRTHQIRVHLSSIGHPVLGDRAYGGGGDEAKRLGLDRPFLHALIVAFHHPVTGEWIEVHDPLPPDLSRALKRARRSV